MNARWRSVAGLVCLLAACTPRDVELVAHDAGPDARGETPGSTQNRGVDDTLIAAFGRDEDADRSETALAIMYPNAGIVVPSNLTHMHYQWRAPDALDSFEVRIEGGDSVVRLYTHDRDWLDDLESSKLLAPRYTGKSVRIRVRALASASPGIVYRSEAVTLQVSAGALPGAAFYWSTTARGIKRGDLTSGHATRVVTDPAGEDAATCTGCHAISRDGTRIAVADGGDRLALYASGDEGFEPILRADPPPKPDEAGKGPKGMMPVMPVMPMPGMPPVVPPPGMPAPGPADYGWGSFSPDATQLAFTSKGKLHILDATTGKDLPKVRMLPETAVTHPDWSPDGSWIAVTYSMGKAPKGNKLVRGSSIARLPVLEDGMIGDAQIVVASSGPEDTLSYPAFSPDGRWIAYARATGVSKDNASAQLWITPADGSAAPVLLERANRPAGVDALTPPAAANSMPAWAPSSDAERPFLTFNSTRAYGEVLADRTRDQVWVSALDLNALAGGRDPSAPPFWLPFQDASEANHRALWTTNTACLPSAEICDGRDDDCDREVDESCCAPVPEDCEDDVDNDCDGIANEGCGCAEVESCDDTYDDDCDQHVDEDCKE